MLADALKEKTGFVPFIEAGDPSPAGSISLLLELEKIGAAIVELGAPFSEPVADGPVIAAAAHRSLSRGMSLDKTLDLLGEARKKGLRVPVILFTYLNPVLAMGVERFARRAKDAGAQAALAVDLPAEESEELSRNLRVYGLELVLLASPTTSDERLRLIGRSSGSIVYYVSSAGVTGARKELPKDLRTRLAAVRKLVGKPVIVGFGIATGEQATLLAGRADGVVVGSALVRLAAEKGPRAAVALAKQIAGGLSC
jgi:tryptophan synthase alpha chain